MTMTDRHDSDRDWAPGHALQRLVFFSDAVFAIAITLLIIEVHAPDIPWGSPDRIYWIALARLIPNFTAFAISFFVIGAFWAGHHRAFDCARHWSPRIVMPNLYMLLSIAAMPFFTAFVASNFGTRVPSIVYSAWLLLTGFFNLWLQRTLTSPPVVDDSIDPAHIAMMRRRGVAVILGSATALVVSFFLPWLAQPALATMPLWRRLLDRMDQRRSATAA